MWIIWDFGSDDFVRMYGELPGGTANNPILLYQNKKGACARAAEMYGYSLYSQAKKDGWVVVMPAGISSLPNGRGEAISPGAALG